MANVELKVLRGQSSALPTQREDGRLLFTTDDGHIYLDTESERVEFYKEDLKTATTMTYEVTLRKNLWTGSDNSYSYNFGISTLRATHPPIITCTDANKTNYNSILSAEATANVGITFTSDGPMTDDIHLLVIDIG